MRTPYSKDVVNQVIDMLLAGDPFSKIHDKFGISSGTISEIKKQIMANHNGFATNRAVYDVVLMGFRERYSVVT